LCASVRPPEAMTPLRWAAASLPGHGHRAPDAPARWVKRAVLPGRVRAVMEAYQAVPLPLAGLAMSYLGDGDLVSALPPCVAGLTPAECGDADSHYSRVVCALCYLAMGGLDEAHNLVTPLSWGSRTMYAGAPVQDSPAAQEASYVHALVHRHEGKHLGEFGTGWSNAKFWARRTGPHPIMDDLRQEAIKLAKGNPKLTEHMQGHSSEWDPSHFVTLCQDAVATGDTAAAEFCRRVAFAEWKLLVQHCHEQML